MKHWSVLLMLLCVTAVAEAAPRRPAGGAVGSFDIRNIKVTSAPAAVASFENSRNTSATTLRNRWLVIDTEFIPPRKDGKEIQWYDNAVMTGELVLFMPPSKYYVLKGHTRFFAIRGDGDVHHAFFYVPAHLLERYCDEGKTFSEKMVLVGKISFANGDKAELGSGFLADGAFVKGGSRQQSKAAQDLKFFARSGNLSGGVQITHVADGLWSKEKTPWANFKIDQYDLIMDMSGKNK